MEQEWLASPEAQQKQQEMLAQRRTLVRCLLSEIKHGNSLTKLYASLLATAVTVPAFRCDPCRSFDRLSARRRCQFCDGVRAAGLASRAAGSSFLRWL